MKIEHLDDGFHPVPLNFKTELDEAMKRPGFKAAWNELSEETLNALLHARKEAGLTQEETPCVWEPLRVPSAAWRLRA